MPSAPSADRLRTSLAASRSRREAPSRRPCEPARLHAVRFAVPVTPDGAMRLFACDDATVAWDGAVGLGVAARISAEGPDRFAALRRAAAEVFARVDGPAPPVFGGLAFASGFRDEPWSGFGDALFIMPRWLVREGEITFVGERPPPPAELARILAVMRAPFEHRPCRPARIERLPHAAWASLVAGIQREIVDGAMKIVLARRTTVHGELNDATALAALPVTPAVIRFAFREGGATFLGATPERLVEKRGSCVMTEALAGTSLDTFGPKERDEHAHVIEDIVGVLAAMDARTTVGATRPRGLAGGLSHLCTPIAAQLAGPVHILDVAARLHPTPAVAGVPRRAAIAYIQEHETPRGWYTGPVGWFDAAGDGELRVALRCALVTDRQAQVFVGAGITEGSIADAEYEETSWKERACLAALGVRS